MAHFAKVIDGIVDQVIVAEPEFFNNYVDSSPGIWLQTSYNTRGGVHYDPETGEPSADQSKALRKNYANRGYSYDAERDAFIEPKPFESWILNETSCTWEPPVPRPDGVGPCDWNEAEQRWDVAA